MPIANTWEPEGLHMNYSGFNRGKDVLDHVLGLSSDPRLDSIKYIVGDFTHSTGLESTPEDVKMLTAYNKALSKINPNILNPTVMPINDTDTQALISLYVLITEDLPWDTCWVKSLSEAREWVAERLNI